MDEYETFIPTTKKSAILKSTPVSTDGIESLGLADLLELAQIIGLELGDLSESKSDIVSSIKDTLCHLPNVSASSVLHACFEEFKQLSVTLRDFIPNLKQFYHEVLPDDFKDDESSFLSLLSQCNSMLFDEKATLVVCGDMSSGKSTLLNVLMEHDVLPSASIRCTGAITEITSVDDGDPPRACFYSIDGKLIKDESLPMRASEAKALLDRTITLVGGGGGDRPPSSVHRCVVQWDEGLVTHGIRLVDTPGLNDTERLSERVFQYLPSAVGMIVTINCNAGGLTQTTRRLIRSALSSGLSPSQMMFVGSKIDQVKPDQRAVLQRTIISSLRACLGDDGHEPRFIPLNIFGAFKGINAYDIQTPDLQRFNEALHDFVASSFRAKLRKAHVILLGDRGVVSKWSKMVSLKMNALRMAKDEHVTLERRVETALRDAVIRYKPITDSLVRVLGTVESRLEMDIKELLQGEHLSTCLRSYVFDDLNLPHEMTVADAKMVLRNSMKEYVETYLQDQLPEKFNLYKGEVSHAINQMLRFLEGTERNLDSILLNVVPKPKRDGHELQSSLEIHPRLGGLQQGGIFGLIKRLFSRSKPLSSLDESSISNLKSSEIRKCLSSIPSDANVRFILKRVFPKEQLMERSKEYFDDLVGYNRRLLEVVSSTDTSLAAEEACESLASISSLLGTMQGWLAAFQVAHLLDWEFDYSKIEFISTLGTGGFGNVYKVMYKGRTLAMKMSKGQPDTFTCFLKEYQVLRSLGLPTSPIVQYEGVTVAPEGSTDINGCDTQGHLCLLMECCEHGDLPGYVARTNPPFAEIIRLLISAAQSLSYMAEHGFTHRDVKGANLLVDSNGIVKAVDFGLTSKTIDITGTTGCGTLLFMAPEMMPSTIPNMGFYPLPPSGPEVDVYSFGMVMLEVVSGALPWQYQVSSGMDPIKFMELVKNRLITPDIPKDCPMPLVNLMKSCWADPGNRPCWEEIIGRLEDML